MLLSKRKQKVLQYLLMQCEFNGSISETLWEVKEARHKRLQLYCSNYWHYGKGKIIYTAIRSMLARGWDGETVYFMFAKLELYIFKRVNLLYVILQEMSIWKNWVVSITSKFPVWMKPRAIPKNARDPQTLMAVKANLLRSQNLRNSAL